MASWLKKYLPYIPIFLLAYIPFHAFITTWAISNFGAELYFKTLKDILIILLAASSLILYLLSKPKFTNKENALLLLMVIFLSFVLASSFFTSELKPELAGILISTRFILFFMSVLLISRSLDDYERFKAICIKVSVYSFIIVIVFGLLQVLVLPKDFLRHFGYSKDIILPYLTVDNNESVVRILSTLRGPNPLGSYIAFMLPLTLIYFSKVKKYKWQVTTLIAVASLIVIYRTFSRSAWIGAAIGLVLCTYWTLTKYRKSLVAISVALIITFCSAVFIFRNTSMIQKTIFHNDPHEISMVNSDDQRLSSYKISETDIWQYPLGQGTGSAGLASTYGSRPKIIENYFLETLFQYGVIGLIIMLSINFYAGVLLWQNRLQPYAVAVLAGLISLTIIGFLLPVWTDETVSLTWWGLAGLVLGGATIVGKRQKSATVKINEKTKAR